MARAKNAKQLIGQLKPFRAMGLLFRRILLARDFPSIPFCTKHFYRKASCMLLWKLRSFLFLGGLGIFLGVACAENSAVSDGASNPNTRGASVSYPLVSPPVKRAAPAAFTSSGGSNFMARDVRHLLDASLDANAFISRFFAPGPTELFNVLEGVDNLITGINMQASMNSQPCLNQNAVAYDLVTAGGNVTMYAQCYETQPPMFEGDPGLVQWGVVDGTFYLYSAVGVGWTAAIATPLAGAAFVDVSNANTTVGNANSTNPNAINPNAYTIHAWYSVGLNNFTVTFAGMDGTGWFNGSYCLAEIFADPNTSTFEMTAAGGGIGFCGAQFVSDGNSVFGIGSVDMGTTCVDSATTCFAASSGLPQGNCSVDASNFSLPPLGRQTTEISSSVTWAASGYPGNADDNVVLNGTVTDSAHFGPTAPTVGVGEFKPQQANVGNGNST